MPPSLVNIYKELHDDLGCTIPDHGCLTKWANQGVLMLNTVLTVRAHQANSHRGIGWEEIYGCGDHGVKRSGPSDRIYFMGRSGAEKKGDAEQSEASDIDSAAPESAVGISWIFREQTV